MRTLRDRKLAMNPSLRTRARMSDDAAHQRGERRELDILRRPGRTGASRDKAGREDRRGRRVGADDEVPRGAEDGEGERSAGRSCTGR